MKYLVLSLLFLTACSDKIKPGDKYFLPEKDAVIDVRMTYEKEEGPGIAFIYSDSSKFTYESEELYKVKAWEMEKIDPLIYEIRKSVYEIRRSVHRIMENKDETR